MSINNISIEIEHDAADLLVTSGLISHLEKFGQVLITGSYLYHLMTVPDIDICIATPHAGLAQAKAIVSDLIDQGFWRGVSFDDFIQFPREDLPSGIYIGLNRRFRDRFWKIDIWLLADISTDVAFNDVISRLTDEQRRTIMQIKEWRRQANLLSIPSKSIYDAVLHGYADDVATFQRLVEEEWHL